MIIKEDAYRYDWKKNKNTKPIFRKFYHFLKKINFLMINGNKPHFNVFSNRINAN